MPLAQLLVFLAVLIAARRGRLHAGSVAWLRRLGPLAPWSMVEVFLLGALVALTKLADTAHIEPGIGLISYGLLMLTLSALVAITPREQIWQWATGRPR